MAVIRCAIEIITSDILLCTPTDCDGYYSIAVLPTIHAPSQTLLNQIKMLGSLCALSMIWLDMGPEPISPNLLQLVMSGGSHIYLHNISFLQLVAPGAADVLSHWPDTSPANFREITDGARTLFSWLGLHVHDFIVCCNIVI